MARTGSYVIADLDTNRTATVIEYGVDRVNEIVQAELTAHNALLTDMMQSLAVVTPERFMRGGGGVPFEFEETDELARDRTQKSEEGQTVGLPLRRHTAATGWDLEYLQIATLGEVQRTILKLQAGDVANVKRSLRKALFNPINETFFDEYGLPQIDLPVKALYNADGSNMGADQSGTAINGATHTHYLANAGLTEALVDSAVRTVIEHDYTEGVEIFVNETNTAALAGFAKFVPALGPLIIPGTGITTANVTNDGSDIANATVGVWDGKHYVRTKSWVPAGYLVVIAVGQGEDQRPLAFRVHQRENMRGLRTVAEISLHPLQARYMRHYFGIAAYNRGAAAIAQFTNAVYTVPAGL